MSANAQRSVAPRAGVVANMRTRSPHVVRRVAVPQAARAFSMLSQLDYEEAFVVEVDSAQERTAQQWARAIFEDAPLKLRCGLRQGWSAFGYTLGPSRSERFVLGWRLKRSTPECVLLAAGSRVGMPAELIVKRRQRTLLFCVFVQQESFIARAMWAGIEPVHRRVVPVVLEQFSRRVAEQES